jgi:group I intron endonuclease
MNNPRSGVIYTIACSENGKTYIGSTMRSPRQRWLEHLHHLRKGKHHSRYLQHAYSKHGEESLTFSVVEDVADANFLLPREQFHIWRVSGLCMNSAEVSDSVHAARAVNTGRVQSDEERAMRSASQIAAIASGSRVGLVWDEEARKRHSVALTGRKMPEVKASTRENISKAMKGRPCPELAISRSVATRTAFIPDELPVWLEMRAQGMSYRDIERLTGRTRKMLSRECTRADNEARTLEAAEGSILATQ